MDAVPVVDLSTGGAAVAIDAACRDRGFFLVRGHGVDPQLIADLDDAARRFVALPDDEKAAIAMEHGGSAWRGWFPLGGELTSGVPDHKEGVYFGAELPAGDPRPMHGANLFPERPAELGPLVLRYLDELTALGHRIVGLIDEGFGAGGRIADLVLDPLVLFRIFAYPPGPPGWSVGEHTDYGLLTILHQDGSGGLQVRDGAGWVDVEPVPGAFVCNIGDMLEKATGGVYRSTPHRVRNPSERLRISLPFFFDPGWDARVVPLVPDGAPAPGRWDAADPHLFDGTYGDYVWSKVAKVFPDLR